MNQVEADAPMQGAGLEKCGELPKVIVKTLSAAIFFPKQSPRREIHEGNMDVWDLLLGKSRDDSLASFVVGENPDIVEARGLLHHVPADAGLGALLRITRIGRK